ncbi:hypothetical protein ASF21_10900 [Arthrobacter sp. Leaf234]|uniref:hypothetical protein n=1 Tax=Arthrobacter sp. Leaf234 TaxID=1736303 RepID=UPI0006F3513E|nr:hypothetical protein [Arthrobacter sp. Leaf234]KQO00817.1 hypothetical protein ASF21_10900 [Arthrobacter sp. Leaf234]
MISYRPIPELTVGRKGIRAAFAGMALAAVLGTTAFAPLGAEATAPVADARATVLVGTTVSTEQVTVRRQDTGGALDVGAAAGPLAA